MLGPGPAADWSMLLVNAKVVNSSLDAADVNEESDAVAVGWAVVEAAVDGYSASVAEVGWDVAFTVRRAVSASGAVAVAVLALDSAVGPGGVEAGAADEASLRGAVAGSDSSFRAEVGGLVSACVGLSVAVAAPNAPVSLHSAT